MEYKKTEKNLGYIYGMNCKIYLTRTEKYDKMLV